MARALLATIVAVVCVVVASIARYRPPQPASRDAPADAFSAQRARDLLEKIIPADGASRTLGSDGNAKARKVLVAELTKAGYAVETQRALSCSRHGACGIVENVVGRLDGTDAALPAVLLMAHYDSVPASPGASDDGLGVAAVVEAARALASGPKAKRTLVVLLSDGEEDGLLGAEAFVLSHPLAKRVKLAVNVDARGSTGPSQMFETSAGNAWLVDLVASELPRPVTTSLFYEVYKRMPNDTDFTAVKRIAHGVNFANTARIEHYHTPDDSLLTSDPGTLQHHGDHVLGVARALAAWGGDPGAAAADGDAVWFDVLATWIVSWPERWSVSLALLALFLVGVHAARFRSWDAGVFVGVATVGGGVAVTVGVGFLLRTLGAIPAPWLAHPGPALFALHGAAIAGGTFASAALARRSTPHALWSGTWLAWSAIAVAAAVAAPGTSYLFVVPALAAAVAGFVPRLGSRWVRGPSAASAAHPGVASAVPAVVAAVVLAPLAIAMYDALGLMVPALVGVPTALFVATLAPFWAGLSRASTRASLVAAAAVILASLAAAATPPFTKAVKQRVNVVLRQDEGRDRARVFVDASWGPTRWGDVPPAMRSALGAAPTRVEAALPWTQPAVVADVPRIDAPPPEASVLHAHADGDRRRVRLHVRSRRGAPTIGIRLPAGRPVDVFVCPRGKTSFEHQGECARASERYGVVGLRGLPKEGYDVELTASGGSEPIAIELFDRTHGVPKGSIAAAVVAARPAEATAFQDGDVTVSAKSFAP